jgi:DNA-binding IclR family transcriptional regulator
MTEGSKNTVQATERSIDLIETLRELDSARLTTLADHVGLPNSTVHNHLSTLVNRGYVIKQNERYRLSLQFLDLGAYTRRMRKIYQVAAPELDEVATETGEVVSLVVEESGKGIFLYSAEGEDAVSLNTVPGTRIHMHTSAMGKAILAQLPDEEVTEILKRHGLQKYTPHTIVDETALRENLDAIRERGLAIDNEERVRGSRAVAVPIRDESGGIIGSIGVSGPMSRLTDERMAGELADLLHDTTNIIELKRTYS